jgi:integrase
MAGRPAKTTKIQALVDQPGTVGEQQAAMAALERVGTRMPAISTEREPLSDAIVKKLPRPEKGNKVYWDSALGGFGIRITAAGSRSFVFDYRVRGTGRQRRYTIGGFPNWTTGAARIKARDLRRRVDNEEDPLADIEEARTAPTVAELADRFVQEHLPRKRPSTRIAYEHTLDIHIRPHFGLHVKVADVDFASIDALHRKVTAAGGPYAANRTVAIVSKMFSLAVRWNMRSDNPAKGIERNIEIKRKRYLNGDELARLVKALAAHSDTRSANIIRLLLLTGARKGEIFAMRHGDIDLKTGIWTKLGSTTKQKTDHVVPLSAPALQLLNDIRKQQTAKRQVLGEFVFESDSETGHVVDIKQFWTKVCRDAGITNLRPHDLRHSFASTLASKGASLPLIGALLGHSDPATTARYAHLFQDPQRAAAEEVGAAIVAAGELTEKSKRSGGRHEG